MSDLNCVAKNFALTALIMYCMKWQELESPYFFAADMYIYDLDKTNKRI